MNTKEEAKRFEALCRKRYPEYDEMRKLLKKRFKKEPSPYDVSWGILANLTGKCVQEGHWGLYRNVRYAQAEQLRKEHLDKMELLKLFEVIYLDINGPQNGTLDFNLPAFDPTKQSFVAPVIILRIIRLSERLQLKPQQIKKLFLENNQRIYDGMKRILKLNPEKGWKQIRKEIEVGFVYDTEETIKIMFGK